MVLTIVGYLAFVLFVYSLSVTFISLFIPTSEGWTGVRFLIISIGISTLSFLFFASYSLVGVSSSIVTTILIIDSIVMFLKAASIIYLRWGMNTPKALEEEYRLLILESKEK